MSPPVPAALPRKVLPGDLKVDGIFVPEGTQIGTDCYCLQHNESFFSNPFAYRPGCWVVDENSGVSAVEVARAESAFSPFSTGTRACVGKNLAYIELAIRTCCNGSMDRSMPFAFLFAVCPFAYRSRDLLCLSWLYLASCSPPFCLLSLDSGSFIR